MRTGEAINMSRRKRYIKGRVYVTNDSILVKSNPKKRRVVAVNNDRNNVHVRRVLSAERGRNSQKGIPIERYPDIPNRSVLENRTIRKGINGKPLSVKKMRKTKTRLNKWDRAKARIK